MIGYIYTITINNYVYVGQTSNLQKRNKQHISKLKANKHFNTFLQNLWNKYGETYFEFTHIDTLCFIENELDKLEAKYIQLYKSLYLNVINMCSFGANSRGIKRSEDTKQKCSIAKKQHWENLEYRKSATNRMQSFWLNQENKDKAVSNRVNNQVYKYKGLISPDGIEYSPIINYRQFFREHDLNAGAIYQVLKGNKIHHKGWKALL